MKKLALSCLAATYAAGFAGSSHAQTFSNPALITINDNAPANPYPATITVSGGPSVIRDLNVSIFGFSHTYPGDVGILLVGPGGQQVTLTDDEGGNKAVSNLNITFDDQAAGVLPIPLVSGTFRPSTFSTDAFASPAPTNTNNTLLSVFNGTNSNGTWSLYVQDFQAGDDGSISRGYSLAFNTVPEPSTWAMLGVGAASAGIAALHRRHALRS